MTITGSTGTKYQVSVKDNTCTCLAYRFQRRPRKRKSCKHLIAAKNGKRSVPKRRAA